MRPRVVKNPVVHKPTRDSFGLSSSQLEHVNYADEILLGSTCGFLNGTGYMDERLLPGSNVLRHKLPPVKLQRSASTPAKRDGDLQILSEFKALEGVLGTKGTRLVGRLRESAFREKVETALKSGDMKALRAAVRGAQFAGLKLEKDPLVRQVYSMMSKYDKILIGCRDGLAQQDLVQVQLAFDHLEELSEKGLGPRMMEHPILVDAKAALSKWAPFRPYLHKLQTALMAGPRQYALYWLAVVEGLLLNPELEEAATKDLARFGDVAALALEEALEMPEVRYHFDVEWMHKNRLPQQVRGSLARLGVDVAALKLRTVRERAAAGWPEANALTSVVVTGPMQLLEIVRELVADLPGEPAAGSHGASPDTPQQRSDRAANHRKRLSAARWALENDMTETVSADLENKSISQATAGSSRSTLRARRTFRQDKPARGPWHSPNMFSTTL